MNAPANFRIVIEDHAWTELDLLRMSAAAGIRASSFIKKALGHEAMMALIDREASATDAQWEEWVARSSGRFKSAAMAFRVQGMEGEQFYSYVIQHAGEALQFNMHPEHYVSHFSAGITGTAIIAEPWGPALIRSYARFCDIQVLRDAGIDVDSILDPSATRCMAALGRTRNDVLLVAVCHQIVPRPDGFVFKTCGFVPEAVPEPVMSGLEEHAAVEFTNMIRIAREAQ